MAIISFIFSNLYLYTLHSTKQNKITSMSLKKFQGIITPLVTPLSRSGDCIDYEGTRKVLSHVIAGGVSGVFILGSTGEGPSLSLHLRREFVTLCCSVVRDILLHSQRECSEFSILVGISDTCVQETISLAKHSADCGADAVVIAPPFYFPITQSELLHYVEHVVNEISLPLFLYNMPKLTKIAFDVDTVRKIATNSNLNGRIVGIKDSSFDLEYMKKLCQIKEEFCPYWTILTGAEHHVAQVVRIGGDGGVVGGSNIFPKCFVSFYEGAAKGDRVMEEEANQKITLLKEIYDKVNGRFVQATKTSLSVLGLCQATFSYPLLPFEDVEHDLVKKVVKNLKESGVE